MATKCKWYPVALEAVPPELMTGDGKINEGMFVGGDAAAAAVGSENFGIIRDAVVSEFVGGGESRDDAIAVYLQASVSIASLGSDRFALVDASGVEAYPWAGMYKLQCLSASVVMGKAPWLIGGAIVVGAAGYFVGSKWNKGKKKGIGTGSLLGAASGAALGLGVGLLASNLSIPSMYKSAGLGAVAHKAYRWQFLTDGEFATMEGGNMHNWTKVRRRPHLPKTPNPILFHVRGNNTGYYYALGDEYAYLLLRWNGSSWVRVKA